MRKKIVCFVLAALLLIALSAAAYADVTIKPVTDPWDDPAYLENDGGIYYAQNDQGYIIAWETPACDKSAGYISIENGTELTVQYRVRYMNDSPWGYIEHKTFDENGAAVLFTGWIQMEDVVDENAERVVLEVPEHPMIADPEPAEPEPTAEPTPTPTPEAPEKPEEAITVNQSYNNAIVYTAVALAVVAIALDVYILLKHKARNNKGE